MAKYKVGDVVIIPIIHDPTIADRNPRLLSVWPCVAVIVGGGDEGSDYKCLPLDCDMGMFRKDGTYARSERQIATFDKESIKKVMKEYWDWHQH